MAVEVEVEVQVESSATPAQVWDVIWDLDRYAEWNRECVEARWVSGSSTPAVGACFTGRNEWNGSTWTVSCHIIECTPPTVASWTVEDPACPSSTWSYVIIATETGCTIGQRFVHGPGTSGITNMIRADPDNADVVIAVRSAMLRENMEAGLRAVARLAEIRGVAGSAERPE